MSIASLTQVFFWCTLIDYGLLILYFVILRLPHKWLYLLAGKPLGVTEAQFDSYNFLAMVLLKMGWILFNLVPYVALRLTYR